MKLSDFDFELPEGAIALHPAASRDASRLLVLDRKTGERAHHHFRELPAFLRPGDALVLNETRVRLARVRGRRASGGRVDALLVAPHEAGGWVSLIRPDRRLREGEVVPLDADTALVVAERLDGGRRRVFLRDEAGRDVDPETVGEPPLPPYIARDPEPLDRDRYQTVFASVPGAVAAPTAGLHFTTPLLETLESAGVTLVRVLLHVGPGTFQGVETDDIEAHDMEPEYYRVTEDASRALRGVRERGGRILAVGTTSTRVLETIGPHLPAGEGWTSLYIHPPFRFRVVDGLITNFHLPRSTLLLLVAAFAGREAVLAAYRDAAERGYRFYSYGDAMLIHE